MNSTNTNVGGWEESLGRAFCKERLFNALPEDWQSVIGLVEINATKGNKSTGITTSHDKVYLASQRELGGDMGDGYSAEVGTTSDPISWFTSNERRIKFKGINRKYSGDPDLVIYNASTDRTDPAALYQTDIESGTIWINAADNRKGYIFVSSEQLNEYGITPDIEADSTYADGGWIGANVWWERSPNATGTTYFCNVTNYGYLYMYSTSYVYGIVPCFSI